MSWYLTFIFRWSPGRWGFGVGEQTGLRHVYLGRVGIAFGQSRLGRLSDKEGE